LQPDPLGPDSNYVTEVPLKQVQVSGLLSQGAITPASLTR
jgi:hypothetical protein